MKLFLITMLIALTLSSVTAQTYQPPKTEHGLPDLQGIWNFSSQTPFERPARYGNQEFLTDEELAANEQNFAERMARFIASEATVSERLLNTEASNAGSVNNFWGERTPVRPNQRTSIIFYPENGRLPAVNDGVAVQRGDQIGIREIPGQRPVRYTHGGIAKDGPEDRGLSERCLVFNSGPPLMAGPYNNNIRIIQNRDHVVILAEMGFDARIVPLTQKPPLDLRITAWSGDSRGYFEGATLVVETRNFTNKVGGLSLRDVAYGDASNRTLIERFTPTSVDTLDYEFTLIDPATFSDHIVGVLPMSRIDVRLYEYACHAGNYALANILKAGRQED